MTDLRTARTPTGPRQVQMEDETFTQRFLQPAVEYLRPQAMWQRFTNRTPEQVEKALAYDEWSEGKDWGEIVKGIGAPEMPILDEPIEGPIGAIGMPAALSSIRKLHKLKTADRIKRGWSKKSAAAFHAMEAQDITRTVKDIPQRLWDRIRHVLKLEGDNIKHVRGRHQAVPTLVPGMDEADVFLNPKTFEPADIFHEVTGHEGSRLAKEAGEGIPNIKTLRNWWDTTHDEMNALQNWIKRKGGDEAIARKVYKFSPDEIFSRHVEKSSFTMGVDPVNSIVGGHVQVHSNVGKTLEALREGLDEANRMEQAVGNTIDVDRIMNWYKDKANFSDSMSTGLKRYQSDYYKMGKQRGIVPNK